MQRSEKSFQRSAARAVALPKQWPALLVECHSLCVRISSFRSKISIKKRLLSSQNIFAMRRRSKESMRLYISKLFWANGSMEFCIRSIVIVATLATGNQRGYLLLGRKNVSKSRKMPIADKFITISKKKYQSPVFLPPIGDQDQVKLAEQRT